MTGYDNLVSDEDCALDLDAASIDPICIVPGTDDNDYEVTVDNKAAFAWSTAFNPPPDTNYRFDLAASDDQCLTGISGQFLTWHIGHVGYTFYTLIEPAPEPVPFTCPVCPEPADEDSSDSIADSLLESLTD